MCEICGLPIIQKRIIFSLFKKVRTTICKSCFNEYYNYHPYFVIPIFKGLLHVFEVIYNPIYDYEKYLDIIGYYFKNIQNKIKTIEIIFIEELDYKFISILDLFELENLIILTIKFKEELL